MNAAPFPPSADLSAVIRNLRGEVGNWGAYGFITWIAAALLHGRLGRIIARMEGLVSRFVAGQVLRRAPRIRIAPAVPPGPVVEVKGEVRAAGLPRGFGWLTKAAGYRAMAYRSQLQHVLAQPEMVALLMACPQAVRALTPLCRALGVERSLLRPGAPVVVPEPKPVAVRVRKPRVPIDWGRIPLPRGVLSAVRRARSKKPR